MGAAHLTWSRIGTIAGRDNMLDFDDVVALQHP
jgi:hypothetical protein